jgi:hypothetical protein
VLGDPVRQMAGLRTIVCAHLRIAPIPVVLLALAAAPG